MDKVAIVKTNWDRKTKKGGWGISCNGKVISGQLENTTSDQLVFTAMTEALKEFSDHDGNAIRLITSNGRVKDAIRHPARSIHCAQAREFKATAKAANCKYKLQ